MQRDRGPNNSLGFGVTSGSIPNLEEMDGGDPDAGVVAKYFEDRPIQRFFAVAGTTIVSAATAGSLVRRGGIKALSNVARRANTARSSIGVPASRLDELSDRYITMHRNVQSIFDDYQGISRRHGRTFQGFDDTGLPQYYDDPSKDRAELVKGFFFSHEERRRMGGPGVGSSAEWLARDEVQQRLVRSARRLPYELPAAYASQRMFTDRFLGVDSDEKVVQNWYTAPVDILGDFAEQSLKNVAFAFLPFDGGIAASKHGYRKLMMSSVDSAPGVPQGVQNAMVDLRETLGLVGHQASDIIAEGVRFSQKSAGAASRAVHDTTIHKRSLMDHIHTMRHGEGGLPGYIRRIGQGQESVSAVNHVRHATRVFRDHMNDPQFADEMVRSSYGGTVLERIASSASRMRSVSQVVDPDTGDIVSASRTGTVRASYQDREYRSILADSLTNVGVDRRTAQDLTELFRFALPHTGKEQIATSRRILTQKGHILGDDWQSEFQRTISAKYGPDSAKTVADNINSAISMADSQFKASLDVINRRADSAFGHLYNQVFPREARRTLGSIPSRYDEFGTGMSDSSAEFLVRRSAERLGINTTSEMGRNIPTSELRKQIRNAGFDPSNRGQLKAFLVGKGDISKPWSQGNFNIFGIRPLSVQEALDSGEFNRSRHVGEIESIAKGIQKTDWDSNILNRIAVGGMHRTASGRIIDTTPIRQAGRNTLDALAGQLKIPLIQIKPLEMLGYGIKREVDQKDYFQFTAGGKHPFLGTDAEDTSGLLWMRSGRGKGRVERLAFDDVSRTHYSEALEGTYRPLPTDPISLAGRSVRLGIGDSGKRPDKPLGPIGRLLNYDTNQSVNLFGAIGRLFRPRTDDVLDPSVFADDLLATGSARGVIRARAQRTGLSEAEVSRDVGEGARNLLSHLRSQTIGGRIVRSADPDISPTLARIARPRVIDAGDNVTDRLASRSIDEMSGDDLLSYARRLFREESTDLEVESRSLSSVFEKSKDRYLSNWINIENPANLNNALSPGKAALGLHRTIDELRRDIMRHHAIREGVQGGRSIDGFNKYANELMNEVDSLFGTGVIGSREAAQARAAIGNFAADFTRFTPGRASAGAQERNFEIIDNLIISQPGVALNRVLEDTVQYRTSSTLGAIAQRQFGKSAYEYPGLEFDPFGAGSEFTLVPTFGTVFNRDPWGTTKSVLGVNTWSAPENFSGASLPVTHVFERMNKALSIFGLGVDSSSTQYAGPLEMFFKGNIGQRMLPVYVAGTMAIAIDRTAGGYLYNERDNQGERIYKPFVGSMIGEGVASAQIALSGVVPGGMTAEEREEQLRYGETPVRRGRFWPLGNTPFRGGSPEYYQPSWYRRLHGAYTYTDQHFGSPMERLLYGHDFSPLRPFDPYRYEEEHYYERPYPVTGDYFTGPWGPLTPALNMTVGRILKPRRMMHEESLQFAMSRFQPVGQYGMAPPSNYQPVPGEPTMYNTVFGGEEGYADTSGYAARAGTPAYATGSSAAYSETLANNDTYMGAVGSPNMVAANSVYPFVPMAAEGQVAPRRPSNVVLASEPIMPGQTSELAYRFQEYAGIYGFGFGAVREQLGFGSMEYETSKPIYASASQAYGVSREFWDLNLGGLGDIPSPFEGQFSNVEFSEVVRRFVPKPRNQNLINPIPNLMGVQYDWLPGNEYFLNFKTGDPYSSIPKGEMRLPGQGYERFNQLSPDATGQYGTMDQFKILADVAPYSSQFQSLTNQLLSSNLSSAEQMEVDKILRQVESVKQKNEFTPRRYSYSSPAEEDMSIPEFYARRAFEDFLHADTYLHRKFIPQRTALEAWEQDHVYGDSFPEWGTPIDSFLKPALQKSADNSPIRAGAGLALIGSLFGATGPAKTVGGVLGFAAGASASVYGMAYKAITGDRYMPAERRQAIAVEEYADVLQYVKNQRGFNIAMAEGNTQVANQFKRQMKSTMYGADIYGSTAEELERAIPKRKREHFREFINAPEEERGRILSTAGRLERRIYQAAWGMDVERRPELDEFFEDRELPDETWEGWDGRMDMDLVKIKMMQNEGLKAAHLGYYPQQVQEANLINPSYPDIRTGTPNVRAQLERLLTQRGFQGDVREIRTPFPGVRVNMNVGV